MGIAVLGTYFASGIATVASERQAAKLRNLAFFYAVPEARLESEQVEVIVAEMNESEPEAEPLVIKRKRGRPRTCIEPADSEKRPSGRPRKHPLLPSTPAADPQV
jgi:hypothetical protein